MDEKKAPAAAGKSDDSMMAAAASIPVIGLIIYFAKPDASALVKNYARQSSVLIVLYIFMVIPIVGWIVACVGTIAWVILLINALQGTMYRLPVVADLADSILK